MFEVTTLGAVVNSIDYTAPLAFDTESTGLYEKTRLAQFYQKGWDKVKLVEWPDELLLQQVLS